MHRHIALDVKALDVNSVHDFGSWIFRWTSCPEQIEIRSNHTHIYPPGPKRSGLRERGGHFLYLYRSAVYRQHWRLEAGAEGQLFHAQASSQFQPFCV